MKPLGGAQRALLLFGLVTMGMGSTVLFAVMPPAARDLGISEIEVAVLISLAALGFMVAAPVWGRLSDRIGRRPVLVTGLLAYAVSTAAFGLVLEAGYGAGLTGAALLGSLIAVRIVFAIGPAGCSQRRRRRLPTPPMKAGAAPRWRRSARPSPSVRSSARRGRGHGRLRPDHAALCAGGCSACGGPVRARSA